MSSDDRLALRASQGDQRAFEAIYKRYHQDLYRFCLAMVGNPHDAQDTLQNTMVKALRGLRGEQRKIRLKPWLYRIARNESVETLRRRRDSAELEPQQAAVAGVTETAETRERLRTLLADLDQLPERQRTALVMRELSGLDFAQIGAAFGTSAAVARQTLYEARLSLRQLEAGREMRCGDVMRELSDADGRVTRRREIRAHLRSCADCRAFRDSIGKRHQDLAALAPLPVAVSAGLLHGVLGGGAGAATGGAASGAGLAGSVGAGAGKAAAMSAAVKAAATVAVAATVGITAADRGGLIDLPLADRNKHPAPNATEAHALSEGASPGRKTSEASSGSEIAGRQSSGGNGSTKGQAEKSNPGSNGKGPSQAVDGPNRGAPSSQSGLAPPGGGYGRSASQRHGRPERLPEAANHGQETANANKAQRGGTPPTRGAAGGGKSKDLPTASQNSAPKPGPPPPPGQAHKSPTGAPPPPVETPTPQGADPSGQPPGSPHVPPG
jgi:RNA polymerase sigma factor (sigma-70 family)